MIGRTIQWEGCATHLELELCCMDVFSVKVRHTVQLLVGTVDIITVGKGNWKK